MTMPKIDEHSRATKDQQRRWLNQTKIVFKAFFESPMTMHMAERQTGVMRSNICFYVRDWKKTNSIRLVKTDKDPFTGCAAGYYSTNPKFWNCEQSQPQISPRKATILKSGQLNMF